MDSTWLNDIHHTHMLEDKWYVMVAMCYILVVKKVDSSDSCVTYWFFRMVETLVVTLKEHTMYLSLMRGGRC